MGFMTGNVILNTSHPVHAAGAQRGVAFHTTSAMPVAALSRVSAPSPYPSSCAVRHNPMDAWSIGSVVEYYSATLSLWTPALVIENWQDSKTLVVQFICMDGCQQRSVRRTDSRIAPLGTNERRLPPSFQAVPSQSRPGQLAFVDALTGQRYGSLELAWRTHLERLFQNSGQPTICDVVADVSSKRFVWPAALEEQASLQPVCGGTVSEDTEAPPCAGLHATSESLEATLPASPPLEEVSFTDPAPSPSVVPMTKILNVAPIAPSQVAHRSANNAALDDIGRILPCGVDDKLCAEVVAAPKRMPIKPEPWEKIASLEGALEESREHVNLLETALQIKQDEMDRMRTNVAAGWEKPIVEEVGVCTTPLDLQGQEVRADVGDMRDMEIGTDTPQDVRIAQPVKLIDHSEIGGDYVTDHPSICYADSLNPTGNVLHSAITSIQEYDLRLANLQREIEERKAQATAIKTEHALQEQELATWSRLCEDVPWFRNFAKAAATNQGVHRDFGDMPSKDYDTVCSQSTTPSDGSLSGCFDSHSASRNTPLQRTRTAPVGMILSGCGTFPRPGTPQGNSTPKRSSSECRKSNPSASPQAEQRKLHAMVPRVDIPSLRPMPRPKSPRRNSQQGCARRWRDIGVTGKPLDSGVSLPVQWRTTYQIAFSTTG